jgi:hypothetical protein
MRLTKNKAEEEYPSASQKKYFGSAVDLNYRPSGYEPNSDIKQEKAAANKSFTIKDLWVFDGKALPPVFCCFRVFC